MSIVPSAYGLGQQLTLGTGQQSTLLPKGCVNIIENFTLFLAYSVILLWSKSEQCQLYRALIYITSLYNVSYSP